MDKYRTMSGVRQGAGLLSGYAASGIDAELLMKVLSNPEMVKVLQMLSKTVV